MFAKIKAIGLAVKVCKELLSLIAGPRKACAWSSQFAGRAVQSVPANIAEFMEDFIIENWIRFCYIARGSLDETIRQSLRRVDLELVEHALCMNVMSGDRMSPQMLIAYDA